VSKAALAARSGAVHHCGMSAVLEPPPSASDEVPMFPPWLDLPPNYLVQDWLQWERGKIVAKKLRQNPDLVTFAKQRLLAKRDRLFSAQVEWLELLNQKDLNEVCSILEAPDDEGQRLRSSSPFHGMPFITAEENEHVRERAFTGRS
jgi:hypothetical protein